MNTLESLLATGLKLGTVLGMLTLGGMALERAQTLPPSDSLSRAYIEGRCPQEICAERVDPAKVAEWHAVHARAAEAAALVSQQINLAEQANSQQ